MLFREVIAVYCENHLKPTNTLREQNAVMFSVTVGGTYSNHWALYCHLSRGFHIPSQTLRIFWNVAFLVKFNASLLGYPSAQVIVGGGVRGLSVELTCKQTKCPWRGLNMVHDASEMHSFEPVVSLIATDKINQLSCETVQSIYDPV
jgi:hypothetical protein